MSHLKSLFWRRERVRNLSRRLRASGWLRVHELEPILREVIGTDSADLLEKRFVEGLCGGRFGSGKPKIIVLNSEQPSTRLRLMPEIALDVIEKDGWPAYRRRYGDHVWIEIDAAREWLNEWLDSLLTPGLRNVGVAAARKRLATILGGTADRQRGPTPSARLPVRSSTEGADRSIVQVRRWFTEEVAARQARGEELRRDEALKLAQERFPGLPKNAFQHRVWPEVAPEQWKAPGRRTGSPNMKGRH